MNRFRTLLILVAVCLGSGRAQDASGEKLLQKFERALAGVQDYTADIETNVTMERVQIPRMKGTLYVKRPDKLHVESERFMMLPRQGLLLEPSKFRMQYSTSFQQQDSVGGRSASVLKLIAKNANSRMQQILLWLDDEWSLPVRMQTIPYEGRVLTLTFAYELQPGGYRMPVRITATFDRAGPDTASVSRTLADEMYEQSPMMNEMQRLPRRGEITILFSNYRINTGLSDDIFRKERKEED